MRLKVLERGSGVLQRMQYAVIRAFLGGHVPGSVSVVSYRRNFFGKHFARCVQEALRAGGEWSVAELEMFAAFVSRLNQCRF
jgi:hypothetical protein